MPESNQSPKPVKVFQAINAVQADLAKQGIGKGQTNQFDGYNFRGIDDVYNVLGPVLAKHQLCVLPRITQREEVERQSAKGQMMLHVTIFAEFDIISAEDGSMHTASTWGEAMDRGDKATNKAMSAAFKYLMFETFCIPTQGQNPDADSDSPQIGDHYPDKTFKQNLPKWQKAINEGRLSVEDCIAKCDAKAPLTDQQRAQIRQLAPQAQQEGAA